MDNVIVKEKEKAEIIHEMIKLLERDYVFFDVAKKMKDELCIKMSEGAFHEITDIEAFCTKLTDILQGISKDKHIRVGYTPETAQPQSEDPEDGMKRFLRSAQNENYGFIKVERLRGNIGYLDLRAFYSPQIAGETAVATMKFLENTDAFIVDLRKNRGGDPEMVAFLCSYFFHNEIVHLNSIYTRTEDKTQQYWTMPYVPGKRYIDKPIYILTSKRTFSGGEEFTYDLKILKRAVVIGEVTGGGANPGARYYLPYNCHIFIPTGTAINPITKDNWEGKGVSPDIEVIAEQAFNIAYKDALNKVIHNYEGKDEAKIREAKDELAILIKESEI